MLHNTLVHTTNISITRIKKKGQNINNVTSAITGLYCQNLDNNGEPWWLMISLTLMMNHVLVIDNELLLAYLISVLHSWYIHNVQWNCLNWRSLQEPASVHVHDFYVAIPHKHHLISLSWLKMWMDLMFTQNNATWCVCVYLCMYACAHACVCVCTRLLAVA